MEHVNRLRSCEFGCARAVFDIFKRISSAIRLCTVLARSTKKATYVRGSVVLYLAFHATELFLKGAILKSVPEENVGTTHNIGTLNNRYKNLYPGKKYMFYLLFITSEEPDFSNIEPDKVKEYKIIIEKFEKDNPHDQKYRYPQNKEGQPWSGPNGFEPSSFLRELKQLRE
ncbi:MAG: hypothetical protein HY881_15320 [Deltaproteobacteria bacterium]|nr:hypothetical protein [Deltaproteobacteria bacterium]